MSDTFQQAAEWARAGRFRDAEALLATILARTPDDGQALHLLASIAEINGDRNRAAQILRRAVTAHPNDFVLTAHLSSVLRALGRSDESIMFGRRAAALKPDDAVVLNDLALAHMQRGDHAIAEELLRRAAERDAALPDPHNNLGLIAQQAGRFEEAVMHFKRSLALNPEAAHAYVNLVDSYTVGTPEDPHVKEIERRLAHPGALKDSDRALLLFAAAKADVDLGRYRAALERALQACELKRRTVRYDEAATLNLFHEFRTAFSSDFMRRMQGGGFPSSKPIFIISMPRAGSTLVEHLLSSHPAVFGAGELSDFSEAVAAESGTQTLMDFAANVTPAALSRIGRSYVAALTRRASNAIHVTDKMPTNFLMAGLIHVALPDAKIVHVRRDPVDTCVSCLIAHFADEMSFSYDLTELGRYYRAYAQLMGHWRRTLPDGVMLEISYEALVSNLEVEARRLLAFCGLPWDDAVLHFDQNRRIVATRSVTQVRQPLYHSSVGRWQAFGDLLQPLLRVLGDLDDEPSTKSQV